jgi:hypothetical protein
VKIFISWSGERSKGLALALHPWLPRVFHDVEPFISTKMNRGINWFNEVLEELSDTTFGVICLTPGNLQAPWINFEAGALAREVPGAKTFLVPLAFDFSKDDLSSPFNAFNAMDANEEGFLQLVTTINGQLSRPLDEAVLADTFEMWWPKLEEKIKAIPGDDNQPVVPKVGLDEKMDALTDLVKDLAKSVARRPPTEVVPHSVELRWRSS